MIPFTNGTFFRSNNPYWGEPAHRIVKTDINKWIHSVPTGSKHGPGWEYPGSTYSYHPDELENQVKCGILMRMWLFVLGNTIGRIPSKLRFYE